LISIIRNTHLGGMVAGGGDNATFYICGGGVIFDVMIENFYFRFRLFNLIC